MIIKAQKNGNAVEVFIFKNLKIKWSKDVSECNQNVTVVGVLTYKV